MAIYARYSSDNQRDASIADQFRMCRLRAEKQGWIVVEESSDHAISGSSLLRPGIQALISDAMRGRFDPDPFGSHGPAFPRSGGHRRSVQAHVLFEREDVHLLRR
ncbi:recombinase family protein [Rhizobium rhizogenes]|uniref:recombinase family protein n=1 Tax=Rhizobium rhizogenes TaxID=359 RepID=UPI002869CE13|nr:recombinase family protein [Rhizobium rhizogenes]